jgi:MoxR-like ATPase
VFANFVLADEINRAPAKVQSALLEIMAEKHVSIGGQTFPAPDPFLVLATQNPIESEGVYPLPEAQRDRFLMKVLIGYPTPAEEVAIVQRVGVSIPVPSQILDAARLLELQDAADRIYVDRGVIDYSVNLVLATRDPASFGLEDLRELIGYGASPRASIGLVRAGRALALLRGRSYVLPQDVFDVAPDVLRHRIVLSYEALARDLTPDHLLARVLSTVPAPRISPSQDPARAAHIDPPNAEELDRWRTA